MAQKTKLGTSLPKFYYECHGLSDEWEWYEISGEVFAKDEEVVQTEIELLVQFDYKSQSIEHFLVRKLDGQYLWPPNDTCPRIIFDEGPVPSWLDYADNEPWDPIDAAIKAEEYRDMLDKTAKKPCLC